jgi:hypothetical protein
VIEELVVMRPVVNERVPEFTENDVRVNSRSVIRVKYNVYSVPSRLIGEIVRDRIYDDRIETQLSQLLMMEKSLLYR